MTAEATAFQLNLNDAIVSRTLILPPGATGRLLGSDAIVQQLPSGAVYVGFSPQPVLVRTNSGGARLRGFEQRLRLAWGRGWTLEQCATAVRAVSPETGLPPDIEPGVPADTAYLALGWSPRIARRTVRLAVRTAAARRQSRLPSIALPDRRIGAERARRDIASFFGNGARVRGLVSPAGILIATGETLAQLQTRVLGSADSAPLFTAIPGWVTFGAQAGVPVTERADLMLDWANLGDRNYRGIGWGMDGMGRSLTVKWVLRF